MTHAIGILEQALGEATESKVSAQDNANHHIRMANDFLRTQDNVDHKITELKQALMTLRDAQPQTTGNFNTIGLISADMRMRSFHQQQSTNQCEVGQAPPSVLK